VISELEFAIGQKQRALQANPYDTVAQGHLPVLEQVRRVFHSPENTANWAT
jgi:pre-mRNA cleavage complex 2 protein Pcf11